MTQEPDKTLAQQLWEEQGSPQLHTMTQAVLLRPAMYTVTGTFEEVVTFLEGWYSGVARTNIHDWEVFQWSAFRQWLAEGLGVLNSEVFLHISTSNPDGKMELLVRKWHEFDTLAMADPSMVKVESIIKALPEAITRNVLRDIMVRDRIPAIIEILSRVQERPGMFVGGDAGVHLIQVLLSGMHTGCRALGCQYEIEDKRKAIQQHGWERHADGTITQMRERGLTETQMVHDLLEIEKDSWRNYHARLSGDTPDAKASDAERA